MAVVSVPGASDATSDPLERELAQQQSLVIRSLLNLAGGVREAANRVARGIVDVAAAMDRESRGDLSAVQRRDLVVVEQTIKSLLDDPMLPENLRAEVRQTILQHLAPPPKAEPGRRAV